MRLPKILAALAALLMMPTPFYSQSQQKSTEDQVIKLKSELVVVDAQALGPKRERQSTG